MAPEPSRKHLHRYREADAVARPPNSIRFLNTHNSRLKGKRRVKRLAGSFVHVAGAKAPSKEAGLLAVEVRAP